MKEKSVKMYLKECTSKLEFWENKELIKLHNKIKLRKVKSIYNFLLGILISINFSLKRVRAKLEIEKTEENSLLCIIPIDIDKIKYANSNKFVNYFYQKCVNDIEKTVKRYNVKYIILSKKVKELEEVKKICTCNNIDILNGKYLFKIMLTNVLEHILDIRNEKLETQNIHIVINQNSEMNVDLIEYISGKVKNVEVVTSQIRIFREIRKVFI